MDSTAMRDHLRAQLHDAMRERDRPRTSVLRSLLSAVENAEAVDVGDAGAVPTGAGGSERPQGSVGAGSTDVPRRRRSSAAVAGILQAELDERVTAAHAFQRAGHQHRAESLRAEATLIRTVLTDA